MAAPTCRRGGRAEVWGPCWVASLALACMDEGAPSRLVWEVLSAAAAARGAAAASSGQHACRWSLHWILLETAPLFSAWMQPNA